MKNFYIPVKYKLIISLLLALAWMIFSGFIATAWAGEIATVLGSHILAWVIIAGVALIPGFVNMFTIVSLILDKRPVYDDRLVDNDVTILIAAYNEQDVIQDTLESIAKQDYNGHMFVRVIDDGSSDNTAINAQTWMDNNPSDTKTFEVIKQAQNTGKSGALNSGLMNVTTKYTITIDADTYLYKDAINRIMSNIVNGPKGTVATAGTILVRNSRNNWLTKIQEFDYFLGIGVVKRTQSLYQGTMVAQGAFSVYQTDILKEIGGWSEDAVGEDIVLTWALRDKGYLVSYAENAFAFTNVPEKYGQFFKQRERWSRGLIEAFRRYPGTITNLKLSSPFVFINLMFPITDAIFLFVFVPSVIAALFFDYYLIVGMLTILMLPLAFAFNYLMFMKERKIFRKYGLKIRRNYVGFVTYMLIYQILMAPAALSGYWKEILKIGKKSWGTK